MAWLPVNSVLRGSAAVSMPLTTRPSPWTWVGKGVDEGSGCDKGSGWEPVGV